MLEPEDQIIMREIMKNWIGWLLLALIAGASFHYAMQADARRLCMSEATATASVCAQAGMAR